METNITVWLAEDDLDDQLEMLEAVHDIDCPVRARPFFSGEELMENVEEVQPDDVPALVIIGHDVAGMSAAQLAVAVRSNPLMHNVPLLLISDQFSEMDKKELSALNNVHFLVRPYDYDQLCEITSVYVSKWRENA